VTDAERTPNSFLTRAEPLWIAALALLIILPGYQFGPAIIQFFGRGGRKETVEWLIYMSLLFAYAPLIWILVVFLPGKFSSRTILRVRWGIIGVAMLELGLYLASANWVFIASAGFASVLSLVALGYAKSGRGESHLGFGRVLLRFAPLVVVAAFGTMCAAAIISWGDALVWLTSSPRTLIALVATTALTLVVFRSFREANEEGRSWLRWWDYLAIGALVVFSFRTYPIVEFYHWGFYIGPIEQLRQGGLLLWDTPSQYGFLSLLIPTALPGNAWVSFWFYQSVIFAVTAFLMYWGFRRLGSSWMNSLFSLVITFTTLFFRPREQLLILPAQMTPSGGPVRFVWCFILLAFIAHNYFSSPESFARRRFGVCGTLIWLASILWSAEAAIYCSGIWFSAYAVFLTQQEAAGNNVWLVCRRLASRGLILVGALAGLFGLIALLYRAFAGTIPDFRGYLEYALLYSRGGFGALLVDPSGSVWYLLLLFFAVSTMAGMYLSIDRRDPRLIVLAGVWGGAWSVGSYFAGRSHPVNALSLLPFLLFSMAIALRLLTRDRERRWHRFVIIALVPAFIMPAVLTLGHAGFPALATHTQVPPSHITEQVPTMEPSLYALLAESGARPTDSFVRIGDGRLMLPSWPADSAGSRTTSTRSWLPKPFEIIGSLSPERRQIYIDRNTKSVPSDGWLIHSKKGGVGNYPELKEQIERVRHETRHFENADWMLSWMVVGPASLRR
jgi:hypothetical protein